MNLYDINQEIEECVDYETGEVDFKRLDALQQEKASKIHNIGLWIKNLRAEASALKEEEKAFNQRRKSAENKAKSLTKYLQNGLQGATFEDVDLKISYRRSQSIETAEDFSDERFLSYEPKVDKAALKEALKAGEVVEGAMLVEKQNIQIK